MKPLLLETIRCEDGQLQNLFYHQQRLEKSQCQALGISPSLQLKEIEVPPEAQTGRFRCRVLYRQTWEQIEFLPYQIRPVHSLRLIEAKSLNYDFKFANRGAIQRLFEQRAGADDVLFTRNGLLLDTSYANVALFDGFQWYTPRRPLLEGTRRAALLANGQLLPADISVADLSNFRELRLINAMMEWDEGPSLPVQRVWK